MDETICVIGLGRIGLPLALLLSKANYNVIGVDNNSYILNSINKSELNNETQKDEILLVNKFLNINFSATNDLLGAVKKSDVVFIAIGTGIGKDGVPDLSPLYKLVEMMCVVPKNIINKLFILKSTVTIGTTREVSKLIEDKTGLKSGTDFHVVFCPERVLGNIALKEMSIVPKIIGAIDEVGRSRAIRIFEKIGGKIIVVHSPEEAELIKLIDNSYRQTLFAFANDLSLITEKLGIDCHELIKNANDGYPRNNIPLPSPGVSGFCLTKDPLYLETIFSDISKKRGFNSVWYWARQTNDYMPIHVVELLKNEFAAAGKRLEGSNILVCGVAYKENTDDCRFSHGLEIAAQLRSEKANVYIWDPLVKTKFDGYPRVETPHDLLDSVDGLIFTVKHKEFTELNNNDEIIGILRKMRTPILIDGWGIFKNLKTRDDVFYSGIGV